MRFPERGLHVSWSFWLLILLAAIVSPLTIVLSILLAAALHECGHLLALRAFHVPIEGLRLSAFGAVLHARGAQRLSYGRELAVTLAGCGMNLVCGVLTAWFSLHYVWVEGFVFAGAHILLCAFNLLPIPPWDGSRILWAVLPPRYYFGVMRYERYIFLAFFFLLMAGFLDGPLSIANSFVWGWLDKATLFVDKALWAPALGGAAL